MYPGHDVKSAAALTKRTIEALKPRACRYDVFDAQLPGFSVRVHPSGRRTYRFKFIFDQRQRVITIGEHGAPGPQKLHAGMRKLYMAA